MAKSTQLLELYLRFLDGEQLSKSTMSKYFDNKSDRTIQRYISTLNQFINNFEATEHLRIKYDYKANVFKMVNVGSQKIDKKQVLATIKILMASRGLTKEEIIRTVSHLTERLISEDRHLIEQTIRSEMVNYKPMTHEVPLLDLIWDINALIHKGKTISFLYANAMNKTRRHLAKPMYLTFSELYFYLVAVNEKEQVIIFRLDRILDYETADKQINSPSSPYYKEGELKQRIYFMYSGEWKRVGFEFNNGIIESVMDRFPTAKLIKKDYENNHFEVEIEVIGNGIVMWLLSQGSKVKILYPQEVKDYYLDELHKMIGQY
ncbi:helix-turn-helix transcriptional regulator [Staphylococcus simulans]|uniref:helix-turn-helix transcriptional regulator n=2 Tax=Staphylococcus simulans TaxID=1286 RepID=UPI000BBD05C1|nr:WYL domain-containing protein [Staphylococcus simulans]ATF30446.1 WYL domain-containing protein [Staphylococcus simulans]